MLNATEQLQCDRWVFTKKLNTDMCFVIPLTYWITTYRTGTLQYVWLSSAQCELIICTTESPQRTVLSPFLFTLYTSDSRYNCGVMPPTEIPWQFSSGWILLAAGERNSAVGDCAEWSGRNRFLLNVNKAREMVIDFRCISSYILHVYSVRGSESEYLINP